MNTSTTHIENKKTAHNDRDTRIHENAVKAATNFKRSEIGLIETLEEVDRYKVYYKHRCNSLFKYAVSVLGLSDAVAGIFVNVCRKTREVPELKAEIRSGTITVSKARRMTSVLNKENQSHWISLAKSSSKHQLEKQIAIASPKELIREKLEYVHPTLEIDKVQIKKLGTNSRNVRVQLQTGVSEQLMLKLRRVQDLVSSQKRKAASLEDSLEAMTDLFLNRHDPLEKAKRQKIRGKLNLQKHTAPKMMESNSTEKNFAGGKSVIDKIAIQLELSEDKMTGHKFTTQAQSAKSRCPGIVNFDNTLKKTSLKRQPFTAAIKHQVNLLYESRCAFVDSAGNRCEQRRHLDVHHIILVSHGGTNEISNLTLLCAGHHRAEHHP